MKAPPAIRDRAVPRAEDEPTIPLWPDAGAIMGLGKDATYKAAHAGEIPVLQFGRRMRVPTARLRALLGLDDGAAA